MSTEIQKTSDPATRVSYERVFISYSHEDGTEFAKELADWLEQNGFVVWLDEGLRGGDAYDATIEREIQNSAVLVAILTKDIERPDSFVRKEIQYAVDCGTPIVPVKLADVRGPILLQTHHWLSDEDSLGPKMLACLKNVHKSRSVSRKDSQSRIGGPRYAWISLFLSLATVASLSIALILKQSDGHSKSDSLAANQEDLPAQKKKMDLDPSVETFRRTRIPAIRRQDFRAERILQELPESDCRKQFQTLHQRNMEAVRKGEIVLHMEITTEIHKLLKNHLPQQRTSYKIPFADPGVSTARNVILSPPERSEATTTISDRYPFLLEDADGVGDTAGNGSVGLSSSQDVPCDSDPTGRPGLEPADLPPRLQHSPADPAMSSAVSPDTDSPAKMSVERTEGPSAKVAKPETYSLQPHPSSAIQPEYQAMSAEQLIPLLEERAMRIENTIRSRAADDPKSDQIADRFTRLHNQNLDALRRGDLASHYELSSQIHDLLRTVYHVVHRPIINPDGTATLLDVISDRYPTLDDGSN
ncbi:MAG: toll/interleukin-1 receptor domain-containing protein [Pirellulaceae bacterium]